MHERLCGHTLLRAGPPARPGPGFGILGAMRSRHTPLIAARYRGPVAGLAVIGAGTTGVLGWRYAGDARAGEVDRVVAGAVAMRHGVAGTVGQALADLGGPVPVVVALLLAAVLACWLRGGRGLALVLVGPPLAMVMTSMVLKPLVERTKGDELAYPSGHMTSVASLAVTSAVLVLGIVAWPAVLRGVLVLVLTGLVVAVGASLVGRDYHYATDTIGAGGVAVAVVLVVALVVDAFASLVADPDHAGEGLGLHHRPTEILPRVAPR